MRRPPGVVSKPKTRWLPRLLGLLAVGGALWAPGLGGCPSALALPEGKISPEIGYYFNRFQTRDFSFSIRELLTSLTFSQGLPNYGRLEGRFTRADHRDYWQSQDYYLSLALKEVALGRGKADFCLGDQVTCISALPVFFHHLFYPPQPFRGIGLSYTWAAGQLTLLGGSLTRTQSFLGESYRSLGERFGGLFGHWHPWEPIWLEGNCYLTRSETDWQGKVLTHRNVVYRLAGLWRCWQEVHLAGEFLQSFNRPVNRPATRDQAYRAGIIWQSNRGRMEVNYRDLGRDFHLLNNLFLPDTNTKGYFLAGQLSPWPWLGLSGSYSSLSQNLVPQAAQIVSETETQSAGLTLAPPGWPNLFFNYYRSNLATRRDFPLQIRGQTTGLLAELNWRRSQVEPYLRYEDFTFSSASEGSNSYRRRSPTLGCRTYRPQFSWYGEVHYDWYRPRLAGTGYTGWYLRSGGSYYLGSRFFLSGELSYRPSSQRVGGSLALTWQLPRDCYLRLWVYLERGTMGGGDFINHFLNTQLQVQFFKTLSWGEPVSPRGLKPGQEWVGSGSIDGFVFADLNQNQVYDPGEPGFGGVTVRLADGTAATTDERGYYRFPAVPAGTTTIILETKRVPAKYTLLGEQSSTLEVTRRAQRRVDFPFVLGTKLQGRVVAVTSRGQEVRGLPDVLVLLEPGDYNTFTDEEGNFAFQGLPPGTYLVKLHPESLPPFALIRSKATLTVTMPPGAAKTDLVFEVDLERPVIKLPTLAAR